LAVESRFVLECRVGPRTLGMARELLAGVAERCQPGAPLLLESDEHRPYRQAMLDIFGVTCWRRRKRGHGRFKHPRSKPAPGLMIGMVHKQRDDRYRVVGVKPRRICGKRRDILRCLRRHRAGESINTAHVERLNGTLRTQQARLTRRTRTGTSRVEQLQASLHLWRDLYHWTRPHASLAGRTPAAAIGLATQAWNVRDYVQHPVHVGEHQQALWAERHKQLLTAGLSNQKHRQNLPTS
jgi:hypothetical protein